MGGSGTSALSPKVLEYLALPSGRDALQASLVGAGKAGATWGGKGGGRKAQTLLEGRGRGWGWAWRWRRRHMWYVGTDRVDRTAEAGASDNQRAFVHIFSYLSLPS